MNKIFKQIRYYVIMIFVFLMDIMVLKKRDSIAFTVGKGNIFSGNIKATFDYFHLNFKGELLLLAHSSSGLSLCETEYIDSVIKTDSIRGLWSLLRARCIVVEYGYGDWFWPGLIPSMHFFVNLWHGIPIKKIGFVESDSVNKRKEMRYMDAYIASSHIDQAMMSSCFRVSHGDVLLSGYPRNDWLVSEADKLCSKKLMELEQKVLLVKKKKKLVLYAPTFRGNASSKNDKDNGIYNFSDSEINELKKLLIDNNAILGLRPHLSKSVDTRITYDETIIDMSRNVFPDVQVILRNTDVLISDYSGVWVDYLLMDRPIIGFVHDWKKYKSNHGYLYDYKSIFPGELVETSADFFVALEKTLLENESKDSVIKRESVKSIFHFYTDGKSCSRLFKGLIKKVKIY